MSLTDAMIRNAKPDEKRVEILDGPKYPGLRLIVQPSGHKSFAVRYHIGGRALKFTIGSYPATSLKIARKKARIAMGKVADGKDPAREKAREKAAQKIAREGHIEKVVERFLKEHVYKKTRPTSARETERLFEKIITPAWRGRLVTEIERADVRKLVSRVADKTPIQGNRCHGALSKLFAWCLEQDILAVSPIIGVPRPAAATSRERTLSDEDVVRIWRAAETLDIRGRAFIRLLLVTGQRRSEVLGMRFDELDLDKALWSLPGDRVKNNRSHTVPLTGTAIEIINSVPRITGVGHASPTLVLTLGGLTPMANLARTKLILDQTIAADGAGPIEGWVFHDCRRTVASGMARLGVSLPVVEKVLNHVSGSFAGIVGVYQKHGFDNEKRQALQLWEAHILALLYGPPAANGVPINRDIA